MALPFTRFKDVKSGEICTIVTARQIRSKTYVYFTARDQHWLGRFEPEVGIGEREITDYSKITLLDTWPDGEPNTNEVLRTIARADQYGHGDRGHWLQITVPIIPIDPIAEQKRLRKAILEALDQCITAAWIGR
jgi:hypothetical protein